MLSFAAYRPIGQAQRWCSSKQPRQNSQGHSRAVDIRHQAPLRAQASDERAPPGSAKTAHSPSSNQGSATAGPGYTSGEKSKPSSRLPGSRHQQRSSSTTPALRGGGVSNSDSTIFLPFLKSKQFAEYPVDLVSLPSVLSQTRSQCCQHPRATIPLAWLVSEGTHLLPPALPSPHSPGPRGTQ